MFDGRETEEERKAKAIEFLKICGFTSTTCCLCGKQVDTRLERLMQCARCHIAHYCSMKCVQRDFEQHREACLLALEFGSYLPPEDPPKDDDEPKNRISDSRRRKPKSVSSTKSLDQPVAEKVSVPKKSKSLYVKSPGINNGANEPIQSKPPRVRKSKSTLCERNPPSDGTQGDEAKASDLPKKKVKPKTKEPNESTTNSDNKDKNDKMNERDTAKDNDLPKKKSTAKTKEPSEPIDKDRDGTSDKTNENDSVKPKRKPKPDKSEIQAQDKCVGDDAKPRSPQPNNPSIETADSSKPKLTRKSPQRHKSSDDVLLSPSSKPPRAKLRRNKSVDETGMTRKSKTADSSKINRVDFGVGGLPKRVEEQVGDNKKKERNSLSGGRLVITKEGAVKEGVRKLIANDGQCCYCGKVVPKHLMLQCARCKLAYYCKMNCLQDDFDLHREICNFVVEYADYATMLDVDYS